MAQTLPYLSSNKNLAVLFQKIHAAKKPETFTQEYLRDTLGLKGSNDRPLIPFLRTLGFLDTGGRPSPSYDLLKNEKQAPVAIAEGVRHAYEPLFKANENANTLSTTDLKGLVSQVAGTDEDMTNRISGTFGAIVKLGDFAKKTPATTKDATATDAEKKHQDEQHRTDRGGLRPEFHYNIQIHLPANASEETYLNIFNALRRTFE